MTFLFLWLAGSLFLGLLWALTGWALVHPDGAVRVACAPEPARSDPRTSDLDLSLEATR